MPMAVPAARKNVSRRGSATRLAAAAGASAAATSPASLAAMTRLRPGSIAHAADNAPQRRREPRTAAGRRSAGKAYGGLAAINPAAQIPANPASGAAPCGTRARSGGKTSAERLSPLSHQALAGGASADIAPKPPSGRFDLAGSLII